MRTYTIEVEDSVAEELDRLLAERLETNPEFSLETLVRTNLETIAAAYFARREHVDVQALDEEFRALPTAEKVELLETRRGGEVGEVLVP